MTESTFFSLARALALRVGDNFHGVFLDASYVRLWHGPNVRYSP